MKITVLGPQGCGKSTQGRNIALKLGLPIVDQGQLIRESCNVINESNKAACEAMWKGFMVPDDYAGTLLKARLSQPDCAQGFVLDGYPRSMHQLEIYDPKPDKVFFLHISDEEAIRRLKARNRADDTEEGIRNRLAIYHSKTSEVLDYYEKQGILIKIDTEKDKEEVKAVIFSMLL